MKSIESLVRSFVDDIKAATRADARAELLASLGVNAVPVPVVKKPAPGVKPFVSVRRKAKRKPYRSTETLRALTERAVAIVWSNSGLTRSEIARRLGVSAGEAQRPLQLARKEGKIAMAGERGEAQYFGTPGEAQAAQ